MHGPLCLACGIAAGIRRDRGCGGKRRERLVSYIAGSTHSSLLKLSFGVSNNFSCREVDRWLCRSKVLVVFHIWNALIIFLIRANVSALQERKNYMDKNIAGLLGAVAGLTTMSTVQAIKGDLSDFLLI